MHVPVLVREVLEHLAVRPDGIYLDVSAGLGGHTAAIAQRLTTGLVIATDRDGESLEIARQNTAPWADRIWFRKAAFSELRTTLAELGIQKAHGLLADLGASRAQLLSPERGLSLSADSPLDMRFDRTTGLTAGDLINTRSEKEIADSLFRFGEVRRAKKIASSIMAARPIRTTLHLASEGRAPDHPVASGHPDLYGPAPLGEPGRPGVECAAGVSPRAGGRRRLHRHHSVSFFGVEAGQGIVQKLGKAGAGEAGDQARGRAVRRRGSQQSRVPYRAAPGAGDEVAGEEHGNTGSAA
jgi:hypothetical protein